MANIPTHDSTNLRTGEGAEGNNSYSMNTSVTTLIIPEATFDIRSTNYSMGTNVVTAVYPEATAWALRLAGSTVTLEGDGTSIDLTWQEALPSATFLFSADSTLTFAQPEAELRLRQNSVVLGNYGINLSPNSDLLLIKTDYIDAQNTLRLTPEAEFNDRFRASLEGSSTIKIAPRVTQWAINGVVTGRRFVPGYFATKSAGSVDTAAQTRNKLLEAMSLVSAQEGSINDLWMRFFDAEGGIPDGSINDRMAYWLRHIKQVDGDSINDLMSNWNGIL